MKKILGALFVSLMAPLSIAESSVSLDAMASLYVDELQAVEANGEIFFMSKNGRYVIRGQLTDNWHKKTLDTISEIEHSTNHIDLDVMGMPLDDMNTITIEGGADRVVAFVDPKCNHCKRFIEEAKTKTDKYTFKIVVVPALGEESNQLSRSLFCAADKTNALEAYMDGDLDDLPQQAQCDTRNYDLTLYMASMIDIQQVPFFIAPDGRHRPGTGKNFWNWIEG